MASAAKKPAVYHISFRWSVKEDDQVGDQQYTDMSH